MEFDLIVRRGRIVDGSGLPSYVADVGVKNGAVVELGRIRGSATKTIDADGLAVSPGFIDHHTHLDAQMLWDPYGPGAAARRHNGCNGQLRLDARAGESGRRRRAGQEFRARRGHSALCPGEGRSLEVAFLRRIPG